MNQNDSSERTEAANTTPLCKPSPAFHQQLWFPAALFVCYLVTYVFLPVATVRQDLEESWRAFLGWAFEHGKQFGTEVIFTYGPWGFLLEPRGTISLYPWQVLGRVVLAIGASSGIALLGVSWIRSRVLLSVWAAAIVILAEPSMLIPILLFLCIIGQSDGLRWKRPALLLIAFAAGLAACTKFTCFILVATLLPVVVWSGDVVAAVTTMASFVFFWTLAHQRVSNLPEFVQQSIEISSGYTTAMVVGRPGIELPLALLVCVLPLVKLAGQTKLPVTFARLAGLGWLAFCEFLIFRQTLIRADPYHFFTGILTAGAPLVLLSIPLPGTSKEGAASSSRWRAVYLILACASIVAAVGPAWPEIGKKHAFLKESVLLYPAYAREVFSLWQRENVQSEAASVDIFPYELSYAIWRHLPLRNRPVIQAYSAYTRKLCEKDAAFLEGRNAPESVYFKVGGIDHNYPSTEDSLVWRSLVTNYVPSSVTDGHLVLKRRESPVGVESKLLLDRGIRTDEFLEIPAMPAGGWIWAQIKVRRTFAGRLLDLLYRKEKMRLQVETTRRLRDFRLLDEMAAIGFVLSPYGESPESMREVFQMAAPLALAEEVRRIRLRRPRVAALGFGQDVQVRLYALTPIQRAASAKSAAW